jgi:hypothetical protein
MGYFEDDYPGYDAMEEFDDDFSEYTGAPQYYYVDKVILPTPVTMKPGDTLTITYTITVSHA